MYHIMIVDDEENILRALKRALDHQFDWKIEIYSQPADALKRAQITSFDLFLSDYRMPEIYPWRLRFRFKYASYLSHGKAK